MTKKLLPTIRVWFCDFSDGFDPLNNYFSEILATNFTVEIDSKSPQFIFFSVFGDEHLRFNHCIKIFYSGENVSPDFRYCDFSFSFHNLATSRNYRLPLFALNSRFETALLKPPKWAENIWDDFQNRKFCCMVVSDPKGSQRNYFYELINNYKPVSSGGRHLNNVGGNVSDKESFCRQHQYNIAFENESFPGYTTEKIADAMMAGTIPIYWGNPEVAKDFNTQSFINCHDYRNLEEVIDRIKELQENPSQVLNILNQPWFHDNKVPDSFKRLTISKQLHKIVNYSFWEPRTSVWLREKITRRYFWPIFSKT